MSALHLANAKPLTTLELHNEAVSVAKDLKSYYLKMFEVLIQVEDRQLYHQLDVPSFYLYCVELLELSPSVAKDFITVVRKSLEVPQLAEAVRTKRITISKARKICSVINEKESSEWIELAANCSTRIVEKAVALANPREAVYETLTYASAERLELKLGVSEDWATLLVKTKDLLSQKYKGPVSSEDALFILMDDYCAKNDPVEKAKRALKKIRKNGANQSCKMKNINKVSHAGIKSSLGSRYRSAHIEHQVTLRDQNQCSYIDTNGKRCESRRWLHKHHIQHFANGGSHSIENLETLCSGHHKIRHLRDERVT